MPWRDTRDPYKIWISEIMLQQTQVKTAINYYNKWMNVLPSVDDVAKKNIDTILKLWEGLGYYKRAHNLHESSKIIVKKYNSKIDYWVSKKDKGIWDAVNKGILLSKGKYITFCDADDLWSKNKLKIQVK